MDPYTNAECLKLAETTTLPFDLNKKIQEGKSIEQVFDEVEVEQQYCLQVRAMLIDLRQFFFVKTLEEMHRYVNDYFYLYKDVANWRLEIGK